MDLAWFFYMGYPVYFSAWINTYALISYGLIVSINVFVVNKFHIIDFIVFANGSPHPHLLSGGSG